MPNAGAGELIALLLFLLFFALLIGGAYLLVRVIRRAWGAGNSTQVRELEARVRDLEKKP